MPPLRFRSSARGDQRFAAFVFLAACARRRSSCSRSSGVNSAPKSSASNTWRISTSVFPKGARLSHSIASSLDFTCHSQKPAISSFVSVKGPSITVFLPPARRPPRLHASAPCRSEANWGSKPSSRQLDGLNRVNFGHVSDKTAPLLSFGPAAPNLSGGGSEVQSDWLVRIGCHGLAFDGPPGLALRKALVLPRPAFARVAGGVH